MDENGPFIVSFPINSMVIFHSYVSLPEGNYIYTISIHFIPLNCRRCPLQAIYQILKRMHRAALFPDDDAEALQIGAVPTWVRVWTH